ncbi:MAG TPA: peptidylprolyl isomerase [Thermoanaerobaculia bacterium]
MKNARLAAAICLLLAGACRREPPPAPDAVARIGGEEVRYDRFAAYLSRAVGDSDSALPGDALSALFDQFLDEQLLARLAVDRGLVAAGDRSGGPRRAVDALLADGRARPAAAPARAEVEAYYAAHRDEFVRPERVRLRQILVEDRATADRAAREIAAGASFEDVARRLSRNSRGGGGAGSGGGAGYVGGDQGELSRTDLPPAYADTIFALAPGGVSRVIPADYGFHLFQVVEHLPPEVLPLGEVEGEIRARLERESADRRLAKLVGECRKRYDVEVYARNLPFDYEGNYREPKRPHR